ncbi:sensor histidine kinase [Ruminococcus sp. 210702-SL.1.03]|uniref:sensor histidine kinase n=1 Tax=Ruminococcus sp. 210702-SL.1.03 TaxID=2883233 RepID=UPI001D06D2D3|nr:GHKL domain-containing protein [Ruminococcus sp. 210702-SL.1.03]MCB6615499.1 GHKL domain-containing protein [Ruminococcus sp. 210702-SL.1.03]
MQTLFYLFSNLFHIYGMYMFANVFFQERSRSRKLEAALYTAYFAINSGAYLLFHNWAITLASNILPFFAITFLYKEGMIRRVLNVAAIYAITMGCDVLVMTLQNMMHIESAVFSEGFATSLVIIAAADLSNKCLHMKKDILGRTPAMYYVTLLFVPLGSIFIAYFAAKGLNPVSLITAVILLLINIDIFYLYDNVIDLFSERCEREVMESQNKAIQNQLEVVQQSQLRIRCLKHDMDNHFLRLKDLIEKEKYAEALEYLETVKSSTAADKKLIDSGNDLIDSMLNYKLARLHDNIEQKYDIVVPKDLSFTEFDLNVIIGNLADNALEALEQLPADERKKLEISIRYKQGYLKVYFGNTFDGIMPEDGSRKRDHENHGLGLKSVERIVHKYGGDMRAKVSDNWYEISLIMYAA